MKRLSKRFGFFTPQDLYRCSNQVNRCYSVNRALPNPVQFHVTSFTGASTVAMAKQVGFVNWDVREFVVFLDNCMWSGITFE